MELYSMRFIIFILVLFIIYYLKPKKQWIILSVGNIVFYSWTGYKNFIYILIAAISTYLGAKILDIISKKYKETIKENNFTREEKKILKEKSLNKKRVVLYSVLILNFGILGYLKYFDEILGYFKSLNINPLGLILPLGISFYTFQSIGYLLDVYNEKYKAENNFFKYFHFISFFPQLIQGPINRYDGIKEDLFKEHSFNSEKIKRGLFRIAFGMLKKYAIANILVDVVAEILDNITVGTPGGYILYGILLYSIQQYADFSGGIDMVLGIAQLFGIRMAENFRQPYFATSLGEFWRRWHISLGAWMRDYVFYPFALTKPMQKFGKWATLKGGKHIGRTLPACIANILVFFLVGLWHGAQFHYILWGIYNGLVIAVSDLISPIIDSIRKKLNINKTILYLYDIILTFIIVNIGWYFDRIEKFRDIKLALKNTILNFNFSNSIIKINEIFNSGIIGKKVFILSMISLCLVIINSIFSENKREVYDYLHKKNIVFRWSIYYIIVFIILLSFSHIPINGGFLYANF